MDPDALRRFVENHRAASEREDQEDMEMYETWAKLRAGWPRER